VHHVTGFIVVLSAALLALLLAPLLSGFTGMKGLV
jgi:hypothetical protein